MLSDLDPNRKIKVGSTEDFAVLMPEYWSGSPTLTFRRDGADVASQGFAVKRAADTCTAISSATLTGTFNGNVAGFQGPTWGQAFLVTANDGVFPVQINRLTTTTAIMREPLEQDVVMSGQATASLVWAWWSAPVPAAISATETGTVPADWRVEYTANALAGPGTRANQRFGGLIHVTAERFSTGVGNAQLISLMGAHIPRPQPGTQGFAGELEAARLELVQHIRFRLSESASGRREDDIIGTDPGFQLAHARLAASEILRISRPEASRVLREDAFEAADRALATVSWYDPNGTGKGEAGTPAAKPSTLVSGARLPDRSTTAINPFDFRLGRERG
jgi:hypothetical protein